MMSQQKSLVVQPSMVEILKKLFIQVELLHLMLLSSLHLLIKTEEEPKWVKFQPSIFEPRSHIDPPAQIVLLDCLCTCHPSKLIEA